MKIKLQDFSFIITIRLDSIDRLENLLAVTDGLYRYFETHIIVLEIDSSCNNILRKILNKKINYFFIEDKDPVLHKTLYLNRITSTVVTPYMAIWDADIVIDKYAIMDSVESIRKGTDVAYPYNGICYEVSPIIRDLYLKKNDIRILHRNKEKMIHLYDQLLVGGAVFVRTDKYKLCGMENEKYYGWGNEDFDRYYRFLKWGMKIYRTNSSLYHLSHPRGNCNYIRSDMHANNTSKELFKTKYF